MRSHGRAPRLALYAVGGVGTAVAGGGASLFGIIWAETRLAKRRIPAAKDAPPISDDTTWTAAGVPRSRRPLTLAVLGDSTAAGYGTHHDFETPAARLALGISEAARRPVHVTNVAVVGAESSELPPQLLALEGRHPDLAVIMIGANDVTSRIAPAVAVGYLAEAVRSLRAKGAEVVVSTCPDLGTIRPLPQPLRAFARRLSRRMAKAQTVAAVEAGARSVSLGDLLGPMFMTNRDLFAEDRFHPSAAGYAEAASAVLPSCLDALGLATRARSASTFTTRRVKPIARAAAQAAARPGSEVAPAERFGRSENRRGGLAQLRRRLLRRDPPVAIPDTA